MVLGSETMNKFQSNQLFANNTLLIPQEFIQQDQLSNSNSNIIQSSYSLSEAEDDYSQEEMVSNMALNYINQMLMAEDSNIHTFNDYSALEATQNSFYEILKENHPHPNSNHSSESTTPNYTCTSSESSSSSSSNSNSHNIDFSELLSHGDIIPKAISDIREALNHVQLKSSKKKQPKKDFVDLSALLSNCSQTILSNNQKATTEKLKQIRQHSSPTGDGTQRLAHYFADAIEARLSNTGSDIYTSYYDEKKRTASDYLKAYGVYVAASPFKKVSHFFSNQAILNASKNASCVHVVDFGINFGFQWPAFIQLISKRAGGPPKVRITGIDFPQAGFRPEERILETGRRLADYARSFNVPFEYKPIASKWEDVRIEEVEIRMGEILIVNCLFLARFLADESTVIVESPRNKFLSVVRRMNPDVFVHGIENGAYGSPFFGTRFREALYHFSALYDMMETTVGREDEERKLIEREIFGRMILNVIACEGAERRERPETYKQWQVRMDRAGFERNGLGKEMMRKAKEKVRRGYHREFDVDECDGWMLQGWKGRIVYALSSWRPG